MALMLEDRAVRLCWRVIGLHLGLRLISGLFCVFGASFFSSCTISTRYASLSVAVLCQDHLLCIMVIPYNPSFCMVLSLTECCL
jgi:hypothetical protein